MALGSSNRGDVSFRFRITNVQSEIKETQGELKAANLNAEGRVQLDPKEAIAQWKATKAAIEADEIKAGFDNSTLGNLLTQARANAIQRGVAERAEAKKSADFVQRALVQGTIDKINQAKKAAAAEAALNKNRIQDRAKAEIAAYDEADLRQEKADRKALKAARKRAKLYSQALNSGERPLRGAVGRVSASFGNNDLREKLGIEVTVDERKFDEFQARLAAIRTEIEIGADDSESRRKFAETQAMIAKLNGTTAEFKVKAATRQALIQGSEILTLQRALEKPTVLDFIVPDRKVKALRREMLELRAQTSTPLRVALYVQDNIDKVQAKLLALRSESKLTSPQLSRMTKIISAIVLAAGPAAISLGGLTNSIGALGVAVYSAVGSLAVLPALLTAAGGGIATLLVGFSGLTKAFEAYGKVQDDAAKATRKTLAEINAVRNAQEAVNDALYAIDKQRSSAAQTILDLQDQQRAVQAQLANSSLSLRSAEASRAETLTKLNRQLRDLKLNQDDANQSVRDAEIAANNAAILGDPEEIRRAGIALKKARNSALDQKQDDNTLLTGGAQLIRDQANAEVQAAVDARADLNKQLASLDRQLAQTREENSRQAYLNDRALRDAQENLTDAIAKSREETNGLTDSAKELEKALANLAPNAVALFNAINMVRPQLDGLRKSIQDQLLEGAAQGFTKLVTQYLPILETGLGAIATSLNIVGGAISDFFTAPANAKGFQDVLVGIGDAFKALAPVIEPLFSAIGTIIAVGVQQLPGLFDRLNDVVTLFNSFVQDAAADGSLADYINDGVTAFGDLLQVIFEAGRLLGNLFEAMDQGGGINGLISTLQNFNKALADGAPARQGLEDFFKNLSQATETAFTPALAKNLGDLFSAFGENLVTIAPVLATFLESFTGLLAKITESGALASILNGLMTGLTGIFDALARPEVIQAISDIAVAIGDVLAALGPVLGEALAAVLPILASVISAISGPLVAGLQGLADFIKNNPELVTGLAVAFVAISTAINAMLPIIAAVLPLISSLVTLIAGGGFTAALGTITSAIGAALPYILPIAAGILVVVGAIAGLVVGMVNLYKEGGEFRDTVDGIVGGFSGLIDVIKPILATILPNLQQAWSSFKDLFRTLEPVLSQVAKIFGVGLVASIVGLAVGIAQLVNVVSGLAQSFFGLIQIVSTVFIFLQDLGRVVGELIQGLFTGDFAGLEDAFNKLVGHARDGFVQGFANFFGGIGSAIIGYFEPVIAAVKALFGIHSPSTVFAEIGTFIVQGFLQGLEGVFVKAQEWLSRLGSFFSGVGRTLQSAAGDVFGWFSGFYDRAAAFVRNGIDGIVFFFSGVKNRIASGARGAFDGLVSAFKAAINVIIDGWNRLGFQLQLPEKIGGVPVPFIGGKTFSIDTPNIPRLASGGVTNGETLAVIGDNRSGKERVTPLGTDGLSTGERMLIEEFRAMAAQRGDTNVTLVGEFRELTDAVGYLNGNLLDSQRGLTGVHDELKKTGQLTSFGKKVIKRAGSEFISGARQAYVPSM